MSWLPTFKIGLWNAWILMLYFPLQSLIMIAVDKAVGTGDIYKKMGDLPYEKREKRVYMIYLVVIILLIAFSVFLPLKLGTIWFYAGLTIYLVGLAILLTAFVNVATTPMGQLFIKGLYHFSRHPLYLSGLIMNVGVGIASASWVFLLLSVVIMVLMDFQVVSEERGCLETYGDEYQEYLNKTPRWIGIPKSR